MESLHHSLQLRSEPRRSVTSVVILKYIEYVKISTVELSRNKPGNRRMDRRCLSKLVAINPWLRDSQKKYYFDTNTITEYLTPYLK